VREIDLHVIERVKEDPLAFGEIYEHYVDRIYRYIYQYTRNIHDAEDLTSSVFFRALTNFGRYRIQGAPFGSWLYRIAHNTVINWHRDSGRRKTISVESLPPIESNGNGPVESAEQEEARRFLWAAIVRQNPDRQQLLALKFGQGLSNAEIGKVMNRTEGAIKALYHRTLLGLRKELEKMGME